MAAMNETPHHAPLTLATKMTIIRILGVPVFAILLIYYTTDLARGTANELLRWLAFVAFTLLALTDALDGYLARSRNEVTHLGRILDPLADKALLLTALILLTRPSIPALQPHVPIWFTALVVSRDVFLALGAMIIHAFAGAVEVRPSGAGKAATLFQMVTVVWVLLGGQEQAFFVCVGFAAFFTLLSFAQYLLDGIRQIEKAPGLHHPLHRPPHAS